MKKGFQDRRQKSRIAVLRYYRTSISLAGLLVCLSNTPLSSSMQDNLEKAFQTLGMGSNVTEGGGYQDQSGGFYTGGRVFARSKVNNADLLSLQLPHYRAGCGGIDLFMGGFSYINAQQFIALLRNIGSNASGYAFNLALATVTPQIKSVLDDLLAKVQKMTNQNINSCEAAATLVGGIWPQSDASTQLLCNAMSKDLGVATDWAQGRQKCGAEEQRAAVLNRKGEKAEFKDILGDQFNIAWKAILKNGFLKNNAALAEFFMTLSGTIISRRAGESLEVKVLPSKSSDPQLISALLTGNVPVQVYKCDNVSEDQCLSPALQHVVLAKENALSAKVHKVLSSIADNVRIDKGLSKEEEGFVNATMIPILKIIAVETAFKKGLYADFRFVVSVFSEVILAQFFSFPHQLCRHSVTDTSASLQHDDQRRLAALAQQYSVSSIQYSEGKKGKKRTSGAL